MKREVSGSISRTHHTAHTTALFRDTGCVITAVWFCILVLWAVFLGSASDVLAAPDVIMVVNSIHS